MSGNDDERFAALTATGIQLTPEETSRPAFRHDYGTHPDQFVEVIGDPGTASATVVLVHGGYFRERTNLAHARPMADALAEAGALCVLVEYRRAGGQPNCLDDVTTAIDGAIASLPEWGVNEQARAELVVAGHSAGGCLVLAWASHLAEAGPGIRLRPLAPVTDLFREVADGLGEGAVLDYMGVRPEDDLAAYLREDPRSRAVLIPDRVDLRIVHGDADRTVDVEFARAFPAPVSILGGATHADLIDPASSHFATVAEALLS
ncbi:alpha/beta hydrolase [Brevibacterium sp. ZH18]|uniref:alpha/beta hydrolase n=1 Tax=Brevibacterium sp. ZH18 TaxID=2927784 RepID=UPI001F6175A7|nr:alpha/beta hydrolase [Brevibacterium sp. ZH18]MCI4012326.1 alpha/beta hydrolase [Brevibacterium sp. ZH18]